MSERHWNALLQCGLLRADINFECHFVRLYLPEHHCTDMEGAIEYAKGIDPKVSLIDTFAGGIPDTSYRMSFAGKWEALCRRAVHAVSVVSKE